MSGLEVDGINWHALRRVRQRFLDGSAGLEDYWDSTATLSDYDRTFGARIGWKWDHALAELDERGWSPPDGPVLDWACGTGVAGRRFAAWFPDAGPLLVEDRSKRAEAYARDKAAAVGIGVDTEGDPETMLISHVVGELDDAARRHLVARARTMTAVVWVEPGDHASSRALIAVREALLGEMAVVAPCTHQRGCGMLADGNERHWCHHFATPPPDVFTDPGWGRFASEMGVDLRSVPASFLVMDRRPVPALPNGAVHTIGRPRVYKPEARIFGCDAEGVSEARISKRRFPVLYRRAKKGDLETLAVWHTEEDEVVGWSGGLSP